MVDPAEDTLDRTKKLILITAGTICVGLGIIGLVLPVVPTSPFYCWLLPVTPGHRNDFTTGCCPTRFSGLPYVNGEKKGSIPARARWLAWP